MALPALSAEARTALAAELAGWPAVTVQTASGDEAVLSADGVVFARIQPDGVLLQLPSRVREMLVETGQALPGPDARQALLAPDAEGRIDPHLLRLAWERARIAARVRRAESGEPG